LVVMLAVLNELRQRGHDIRLRLVGNITETNLMKKIETQEYFPKIKNYIDWHGLLNIEESYKKAFDCFAGLSVIEPLPNHIESYSTKIFEYMAVGLPVIATNTIINKAVVEAKNCGICVPYNDILATSDAIEKIYLDKKLQHYYAENGFLGVSNNYNWKTEKNILLDFYSGII